jgi:hypothetical protein
MLGIALSLMPCLRLDCARGCVFTTKFRIVFHDLMHQIFDYLPAADEPILPASATVFAIASMTSFASAVSTLSDPAVAGYSAKKSLITSVITPQGHSWSFSNMGLMVL